MMISSFDKGYLLSAEVAVWPQKGRHTSSQNWPSDGSLSESRPREEEGDGEIFS